MVGNFICLWIDGNVSGLARHWGLVGGCFFEIKGEMVSIHHGILMVRVPDCGRQVEVAGGEMLF